jgi:hypothetical protein
MEQRIESESECNNMDNNVMYLHTGEKLTSAVLLSTHSVICRTSSAIQFATCIVAFVLLGDMKWNAVLNPPIFNSSKATFCVRPATLPLSSTVASVDIELLHPPFRLGS